MGRIMNGYTTKQSELLFELQRQGYHDEIMRAEASWARGIVFVPKSKTRLSGLVRKLVQEVSWELTQVYPNVSAIESRRVSPVMRIEQTNQSAVA
jgi:hypothetical protein